MNSLLSSLNARQYDAVTAPLSEKVLVLAGAGSGKTRVLTYRIAYLIQVENLSPYSIFAVTFTNKAAAEMRARLEENLGISSRGMWVGTFHGIAHRLLRAHFKEAHLAENFQILDSDDQYRLIKRIQVSLNVEEEKWPVKQTQWFINHQKEAGLRPEAVLVAGKRVEETLLQVYKAYEEACARTGMVDFAELLLRAYELFRDNPDILQHYQARFRAVLVDEFQDTSALQYAWLRLLCAKDSHLMLVGDDDQSIYGWRGAKVENILNFEQDYPQSRVIKLEQNYRSTQSILQAANAVIHQNDARLGKELWTEGNEGEPISLYAAFNELDEARFIVARILDWVAQGHRFSEAAILYRSNAQSRVLEEALLQQKVPYRVYGGMRFFERSEIKDALAYLRLVAHREDDSAFERVVNTPTRGIGDRTLVEVREKAKAQGVSLWQAAETLLSQQSLPPRASSALLGFLHLIEHLAKETLDKPLDEQVEQVIQFSGLIPWYRKEKGEKGQMRIENLEELVTAAKAFKPEDLAPVEEEPRSPQTPLQAFLAYSALEAGEQQAEIEQDSVQMMTLHSAKGLEFPLVFMAGVEEGLFPHHMSLEEAGRLEEERRLCYVGITRAMQKLYVTYAENRRLHGMEVRHTASRFIREIPAHLIVDIRPKKTYEPFRMTPSTFVPEPVEVAGRFRLGQTVYHEKFGKGTLLNYEGSDAQCRVQIKFQEGVKNLMLAYAKLKETPYV